MANGSRLLGPNRTPALCVSGPGLEVGHNAKHTQPGFVPGPGLTTQKERTVLLQGRPLHCIVSRSFPPLIIFSAFTQSLGSAFSSKVLNRNNKRHAGRWLAHVVQVDRRIGSSLCVCEADVHVCVSCIARTRLLFIYFILGGKKTQLVL